MKKLSWDEQWCKQHDYLKRFCEVFYFTAHQFGWTWGETPITLEEIEDTIKGLYEAIDGKNDTASTGRICLMYDYKYQEIALMIEP